jgi:tetratricopeptide (TPR) repeat protein
MNPDNRKLLKALWKKAEQADQGQSPATAIELFRLYLRFDPEKSYAHFLLAENLRVIGRIDEAEESMNRVISVPESKQWLVQICWAEIHAAKGRKLEAEESFQRAIALMPNSTVPYVYYGAWLSRSQRFGEAIAVLCKGLAAEGDLDEVYLNLGNFKRASKDLIGAKDCYQKALEINPTPETKARLMDVLQAIDVIEESVKYLRQ